MQPSFSPACAEQAGAAARDGCTELCSREAAAPGEPGTGTGDWLAAPGHRTSALLPVIPQGSVPRGVTG